MFWTNNANKLSPTNANSTLSKSIIHSLPNELIEIIFPLKFNWLVRPILRQQEIDINICHVTLRSTRMLINVSPEN